MNWVIIRSVREKTNYLVVNIKIRSSQSIVSSLTLKTARSVFQKYALHISI